ncbi:hypothetical protein ACHAXA_001252 [Cyclostephanos tholiformis]|uniref:Uncharacterized protein n=1 Tax=Cyclostephanos tholiformis TaxID=382380 RepID=A0ABD3RCL6_9STRA
MSVGKLYSVSFYPSSPWLLACGGSGNELAIWDMEGEDAIRNRFAGRIHGGEGSEGPDATYLNEVEKEPDFEATMAASENDTATLTTLEGMNKSKKKKGKKKNRAHKRK